MKFFKNISAIVAMITLIGTAPSYSDEVEVCRGEESYQKELEEKDWDALYDYINTKRTMNVQEKACNLTISGDVRADWRNRTETRFENDHHECLRGGHACDRDGHPRGRSDYDIQFNLRFDYVCNRAWAVAHMQLDNNAGICANHSSFRREEIVGENGEIEEIIVYNDPNALHGSGTGCDIDLKKAYFGYNILCDGATRFDIEIGRRRLYQIFASEVQFLSRFDGILLKYDSTVDNFADWYVHLGGFVVDYNVNHYAWIIEADLDNMFDTGLEAKYSFIDWRKNGRNFQQQKNPLGAKFLNSQFTLYYHLDPDFLCVPAKLFGAYLVNHNAPHTKLPIGEADEDGIIPTESVRANQAWYAGFTIGEVVLQGDWSFSAQYQWVQARSIPDDDVSGIGNGNANRCSFTKDGIGNTNFKGWRLELLYAFTDNITIDTRAEWSEQLDSRFVGDHSFSQFKIEAIYAF